MLRSVTACRDTISMPLLLKKTLGLVYGTFNVAIFYMVGDLYGGWLFTRSSTIVLLTKPQMHFSLNNRLYLLIRYHPKHSFYLIWMFLPFFVPWISEFLSVVWWVLESAAILCPLKSKNLNGSNSRWKNIINKDKGFQLIWFLFFVMLAFCPKK